MDRYWRGLKIYTEISDEWLDRLLSIPGITVYFLQYGSFAFTLSPWLDESDIEPMIKELEDTFSDIATVEYVRATINDQYRKTSEGVPVFIIHQQDDLPAWRKAIQKIRGPWWKQVIKRLEEFAARQPMETQTVDDLERDIILGASEALGMRQESFPHERTHIRPFGHSTPSSRKEAIQYLEALADLNKATVYDVYLDDLESIGGTDTSLHRFTFGYQAALRGLGLQRGNEPLPTVDYLVPVWNNIATGPFNACVLTLPQNGNRAIGVVSLELPEHNTLAKFTLYENKDLRFHGCDRIPFPSRTLEYLEKARKDYGGGEIHSCESLEGKDVADYIASFFSGWRRERIFDEVQNVLANCFAKD